MTTMKLLRSLLAATCLMTAGSLAMAQCDSCDSGCGNGGSCEGRCQYCVDGVCTPNRLTYGYYETNWRRWPVPAPAVPTRSKRRPQGPQTGPTELDLPSAEDETEIRPEFPRLRKRAGGNAAPMNQQYMPMESMPMESMEMDMSGIMPETIMPETTGDMGGSGTRNSGTIPGVEVPPSDMEGELFDGASVRRKSNIRQASAQSSPDQVGNPLRTFSTPTIQTSATMNTVRAPRTLAPVVAAPQPLPKPLPSPSSSRVSNPLR